MADTDGVRVNTEIGYKVQVSTRFAPEWRTLEGGTWDIPRTREQASLTARGISQMGGYVRVIDPDGNYVEGRTEPFGTC